MMTLAETSRLERSYGRNLGWCRFWLGISLAVVTLTFTFAVDRVFVPDTERPPAAADARMESDNSDMTGSIGFIGIAVVFALIFVAAACASLSARFRTLYVRNDAALAGIEPQAEEATP